MILFAIFSIAMNLHAASFYVDKDASGSNNGTSWTNAWESFSNINWDLVHAGDVIYISGGSFSKTYTETLTMYRWENGGASGTVSDRITICPGVSQGHNGTVIIEGDTSKENCIYIKEYDYIKINGLKIKGGNIRVRSATGVIVEDCNIDVKRAHGGVMVNGYGIPCRDCIVRNNRITNPVGAYPAQTDGIYSQMNINCIYEGNNILIRNEYSTQHTDGIQLYKDKGTIIRNNYIEHLVRGSVSPHSNGIMTSDCSGTLTLYNNVIYTPYFTGWGNTFIHI